MTDKLQSYRRKRDFGSTREPAGKSRRRKPKGNRFVVQEHHARRLHWDFRLERDGVLVSWAVPKGIPPDPKTNHLAVQTEDHPLDYIDFEGEIPEGQYGAGRVLIWDRGTYEVEKWRDDEVMVVLHGERVQGKYVLFQTRGKDWLMHRMDPPQDPDWEPLPEPVKPMLACLGTLPRDGRAYGYEIKWDGVRTIASVQGGSVTLASRTRRDVTAQYPEMRGLGRALGAHAVMLDGEIVAFDDEGRPSFGRLQTRMQLTREADVRRRMKQVPAHYMLFDLLYLDGHSTMGLPYTDRRELLEGLELEGDHWRTPENHLGEGSALLEVSRQHGLEGIVAKRLDSPYEAGKRSRCWVKVKNVRRQRLVIGGWLPGAGRRSGGLGALLVGYHDKTPEEAKGRKEAQRLVYAGRVGTGFTHAELDKLAERLAPLRRDRSPFDGRQPPKASVFVEPKLVAEIEFIEFTSTGTLRAPSYKGLVPRAKPRAVVREES